MKIFDLVKEADQNSTIVLVLKSLIGKSDEKKIPGNFTWDQINRFMTNIGEEDFDYETFKMVYDSDPAVKNLVDRFDAEGVVLKTKTKETQPDQGAQQGDNTVSQMAQRATANAQAQELGEAKEKDEEIVEPEEEKETISSQATLALMKLVDEPRHIILARKGLAKLIDPENKQVLTPQEIDAIGEPIEKILLPIIDKGIAGLERSKALVGLDLSESDDSMESDILDFLGKKLDRAQSELQNAPATTPEEQENKDFALRMFQFMQKKMQEKKQESHPTQPKTVDIQKI